MIWVTSAYLSGCGRSTCQLEVKAWRGLRYASFPITAHQDVTDFTDRTRPFVWHWGQSFFGEALRKNLRVLNWWRSPRFPASLLFQVLPGIRAGHPVHSLFATAGTEYAQMLSQMASPGLAKYKMPFTTTGGISSVPCGEGLPQSKAPVVAL